MGAFGEAFGRLFRPFWELVGLCWTALPLQRERIFSGLWSRRSAFFRPLLQVWISGCFFSGSYVIVCDLGSYLGWLGAPFWLPLGTLFRGPGDSEQDT